MKKIFSILIAVFILVSCMITNLVCLASEFGAIDELYYEISDEGKVTITNYYGHDSQIVIPSTIKGYPVTCIGDGAFAYCSELVSITIPDTITSIKEGAFSECENFKNVYISDLVAWFKIDYDTCYANPLSYGANLYLNGSLLTNIVIPDNITKINYAAFCGYKNLKSVTFHDNVVSIGDRAFESCDNIENVYITNLAAWCEIEFFSYNSNPLFYAENLYVGGQKIVDMLYLPLETEKINDYAFWGFKGLKNIEISANVIEIGKSAIIDCPNLNSISVHPLNNKYSSDNGILFNKSKTELILYPAANSRTSYTIPNSVTVLGDGCFRGSKNLNKVIIGDNVNSIGITAFYNSFSLGEISIGKGVKSIATYAFYMIPPLKKVNISDISAWCNVAINQDGSPFQNGADLYLDGKRVTNLIIPESTETIGIETFKGCTSIESVTIPRSVKSIGNAAFFKCNNIKNVWYTGTEEEFENIKINSSNSVLTNAKQNFNACPVGANHIYDNACDTVCNICKSIRSTTHNFKWAIDKEPTCTEEGIKHEVCTVCLIERNKTSISVQPHTLSEWSVIKESNCTSNGEQIRSCSKCSYKETKKIDALGHKFINPIITKQPTCTETGIESGKCTRCNKETINIIEAKGHNIESYVVTLEATCTSDGKKEGKCTVCGISDAEEIINATGHKFDEGVVTKEATKTEIGLKTKTCTVCGEINEEVIPALETEISANNDNIINSSLSKGNNAGILIIIAISLTVISGAIAMIIFIKKRKNI